MPAADDIKVFGFQDPSDHFGLTLQGAFLDLPGDPNYSVADLNFKVEVSEEGQLQMRVISDAHLYLGGVGIPDQSEFRVDESFQNAAETLEVFQSSVGNEVGSQLSDWVDFAQTSTSRQVQVVISAMAASTAFTPARASAIDLSFSQTVIPEPSTAMLLALGTFVGVGHKRRRFV